MIRQKTPWFLKRITYIGLLVWALILRVAACGAEPHNSTKAAGFDKVSYSYGGGCFMVAYSGIDIFPDGKFITKSGLGHKFLTKTHQTGSLTEKELAELRTMIDAINWKTVKSGEPDNLEETITVVIGRRTYESTNPPQLTSLMSYLCMVLENKSQIAVTRENLEKSAQQVLSDRDVQAASFAADALGSLGARGDSVIANRAALALATAICHTSSDMVARRCAVALGAMGQKAVSALPLLRPALKDTSSLVRVRAMHALLNIGPCASPAVVELIDILAGPNERLGNKTLHSQAAAALTQIGKAAEPAVPALIKALDSDDAGTKFSIVGALGRIGPPAYPAVPKLIQLLNDKDSDFNAASGLMSLRKMTISALGNIDPKAKSAIPALERIVGKKSISENELSDRSWANQSIRQIRSQGQ